MAVQEAKDYASYVDAMAVQEAKDYASYVNADDDFYLRRDAAEFEQNDFSYLQPEPDYDPCPF